MSPLGSPVVQPAVDPRTEFVYVGRGVDRKEPIIIPDNYKESSKFHYSKDKFLIPSHYVDDVKSVMIPRGLAADRIMKLAIEIREMYGNEELHLICILKGSRGFFSELVECLDKLYIYTEGHSRPPYMEHYVRIKSHVDSDNKHHVNIMSGDLSVLKGKNVIIVEDIIESGRTLKAFCRSLLDYHVKSLRIASMIEKRSEKSSGLQGDFVGFSIPGSVFVGGFCIDYQEMFRDLPHVCLLEDSAVEKYRHRK
jgi:hypoxanthine phosphoribosyltransferase